MERLLKDMAGSIAHRGPDDSGTWVDVRGGVGLAHRRLSIQDLSPSGAQPMMSPSGRFVIVFNGEIYNFLELRKDLEDGYLFQGSSDTEVMLAAFERWGVERALERFAGMFAFTVVDSRHRTLHLARDRMGEKPLYYGFQKDVFLFGSELKAMCVHPAWEGEINRDALTLLLRHNYIPGPHTIYQGISKLGPGCLLSLNLDNGPVVGSERRYWRVEQWVKAPGEGLDDPDEASDMLEQTLMGAVRQQMISDAPLGAFLSGGIDSSTIVALMQEVASRPVKTFTIGFFEDQFNEAKSAKAVAGHLGTDHTELYVTPEDALDVIPGLPAIYDEPFADSSQIPTFLISRMTREHVTVALSGDGGDELFCGYSRYADYLRWWRNACQPSLAGRARQSALQLPLPWLPALVKLAKPSYRVYGDDWIQDKILRLRLLAEARALPTYYRTVVSYWHRPEDLVKGAREPSSVLRDFPIQDHTPDGYAQMMILDALSYLPDDILVKVDRAAMANSLETRTPLLDHRVVQLAYSFDPALNACAEGGKAILKRILHRYVPKEIVERPKQGFAVPIGKWLRRELRDWAETQLDPGRLREEGYFDGSTIQRRWSEHLTGRCDHSFELWGILMFQAWLAETRKASPRIPQAYTLHLDVDHS